MAAKTPCPVTGEELKALYDDMPSSKLAAYITERYGISVSKTLIINWLKKHNIPRRKYSPYQENRIECPFTPDRLHEMYWLEGMACADIGAAAEKLIGRTVADAVVQRWLREANIRLRTPHEWLKLRAAKDPERWRDHIKHARAAKQRQRQTSPLTPAIQLKGRKAAAEAKKAARPWETRRCTLCNKEITKPARMFRNPPERTFCSKSCASKYNALPK